MMIRKTVPFFICVASIILLSGLIQAQKGVPQMRSRALFVSGAAPGMEVKVLKSVNGAWTLVDPATEKFKECDQFKVDFKTNIAGYVYFINITPAGKTTVIHREAVKGDGYRMLPGGTPDEYRNKYVTACVGKMPAGSEKTTRENFIFFDNEVGTEILKLVLSPKPISALDQALDEKQGALVASATAPERSKPPVVGCRALNIKCRSVGFDPPDVKKDNGGVYVAIPDKKTGVAQALGENEALTFEVRLNHVKR
jgi:hypothetical protein